MTPTIRYHLARLTRAHAYLAAIIGVVVALFGYLAVGAR